MTPSGAHLRDRAEFRRRLIGLPCEEAAEELALLLEAPPEWSACWPAFGAIWALPAGLAALAYTAVDRALIEPPTVTIGDLTAEQRAALSAWLRLPAGERARVEAGAAR